MISRHSKPSARLRRPGSDVVRNFAGKSLDMLRGMAFRV